MDRDVHYIARRAITSNGSMLVLDPGEDEHLPVQYVTVYRVTREYGGPEEGGWYYTAKVPVCTVPLAFEASIEDIVKVVDFLAPRFVGYGDIYSVRGGERYDFVAEAVAGSHKAIDKPVYE